MSNPYSIRCTAEFKRDAVALTTAEREELVALRRRVREQGQVIGVLKRAAAFFAQDNL